MRTCLMPRGATGPRMARDVCNRSGLQPTCTCVRGEKADDRFGVVFCKRALSIAERSHTYHLRIWLVYNLSLGHVSVRSPHPFTRVQEASVKLTLIPTCAFSWTPQVMNSLLCGPWSRSTDSTRFWRCWPGDRSCRLRAQSPTPSQWQICIVICASCLAINQRFPHLPPWVWLLW